MTTEQRTLTEDECYNRLRELIINGTYLPNQHLVEMELASAFNVNRASIRTALARLEQEGLVERERYRGARVRLVTEQEAIEILEARESLEGVIARTAATRATDEDIRELHELIDTLKTYYEANDLLRYSETNSQLHKKIAAIAKHSTASRLLDMLNSQNVRFQFRTILASGRPEKSFAEHKAIVEAIAQRDPHAAESAMRLHLSHVTETLRQIT
ncbi:GntR family transcriptional regulator [Alicyclobacillus fastidiosus]|uniref:GntR family transcriptional regulator n=1 Tax=Alicyclobacillus fastidiosus TaxID=392011 RepID=A0ABY6ZFD5_9BACL|nr:GntR family transcriptional regulator [Alicyclobacillus fastidiosus]WAH41283.1 GntR family transcriptional regulator [Alicyclobacillus fastidiosus]GMA62880.1 GntR family transcriptional regulator [Alicyclobacillus fastidiosus]